MINDMKKNNPFNLNNNQKQLLGLISEKFEGASKLFKTIYLIDCLDNTFNYNYVRAGEGPFSEEFLKDFNYLIHCNLLLKIYKSPKIVYKINPDLVEVRGDHKYNFLKNFDEDEISHLIYNNTDMKNLEIGDWFPLSKEIKNHLIF